MRRIVIAFGGLLALVGLFLILRHYVAYCGSDWVRTEFASLDEAKAAKAFDRGWLPPILPDGATKIVEVNDVESNNGEGSFHFPAESTMAYLETMRTNYAARITTNETGITIQIMTDNTCWAVEMDPQLGRGKYTVGLRR